MRTSTSVTFIPGALFASATLILLKIFTVEVPWLAVLAPVSGAVAYALLMLVATIAVTGFEHVVALFDGWRSRVNASRPNAVLAKADPEPRLIPSLY